VSDIIRKNYNARLEDIKKKESDASLIDMYSRLYF
jgi:hypothetical protein